MRAENADIGKVIVILDEAAEWLRAQDVDQWPLRFQAAWVEPAIARGETWLVLVDGEVTATLTLDWSDPLWIDEEGEAGYVHRTAVRRSAAGLGRLMLDWAVDFTRQHRRGRLRLDCVESNARLRAYYEKVGFVHRGDRTVGGPPGQRRDDGQITVVSRYEYLIPSG